MGELRRLLRVTEPRCAHLWSTEGRGVTFWHVCDRSPGHTGDHACRGLPGKPCEAVLAQAGAA